jgi:hypothetical protein
MAVENQSAGSISPRNAVSDANGNVPTGSFYGDAGNIDPTPPIFIDISVPKSTSLAIIST